MAALLKDLDLVPSTQAVAQSHVYLHFRALERLLAPTGTRQRVHILHRLYAYKTLTYIRLREKIKISILKHLSSIPVYKCRIHVSCVYMEINRPGA